MTVLVHDPPTNLDISNHIINPIDSPGSTDSTSSVKSMSSGEISMGVLVSNKDRRTSLASDHNDHDDHHHGVSLITSTGSDEYVFAPIQKKVYTYPFKLK